MPRGRYGIGWMFVAWIALAALILTVTVVVAFVLGEVRTLS